MRAASSCSRAARSASDIWPLASDSCSRTHSCPKLFSTMYRTIQSGVKSWVAAGMRSLVILTFFFSSAKVSSFSAAL